MSVLNNELVKILKVSFEMVDPQWAENAELFDGERFLPDRRRVPDEHWHTVTSMSTTKPDSVISVLDQYRTLTLWETEGTEPVRNVRLFQAEEPVWTEVDAGEVIDMGEI